VTSTSPLTGYDAAPTAVVGADFHEWPFWVKNLTDWTLYANKLTQGTAWTANQNSITGASGVLGNKTMTFPKGGAITFSPQATSVVTLPPVNLP
jgi:hypothetical protein